MPNIFFDVGANSGSNSLHLGLNPDWIVYAFEPTPRLYENLVRHTKDWENYHVFPYAVSNKSGKTQFNVAGQGDWGTSSLLEFASNIDKTWHGRTDFKVTERIDVEVITLAEFVKDRNIECIDLLHTDVQGLDLEVLMGLGEFMNIVKSGEMETARNHDVKLYGNQKYVLNDCVLFLYQNGFKITEIISNDERGVTKTENATLFNANELNINYERAGANFPRAPKLEEKLNGNSFSWRSWRRIFSRS